MSGDPLEHDETDPGVTAEGATTDRPEPIAGDEAEAAAAEGTTLDPATTGERDSAAKLADEDAPIDPETTLQGERIGEAVGESAESFPPEGAHAHPEEEAPTAITPAADEEPVPPTDEPEAEEDPTEDIEGVEHADGFPNELDATVNLTGDLDATVNLTGELPGLDGRDDAAAAHEVTRGHLKGLLEALIFASDKPIRTGELAKAASAPSKEVKGLLEELRTDYAPRGMQLDEVAGGWIFRTNAAYAPFVRDLTKQKPVRLTRAQIETLAILAYRQPVTRPEIDEIRGVDCGPVLKLLLERDLVRMLGRKDEVGRPVIYGTTVQFLELFGLKSLKDLPTLREFTDLNEESRRTIERELGETMAETVAVTSDGPRIPAPSDTLPPGGEGAMNTERPPAMHEEAVGEDADLDAVAASPEASAPHDVDEAAEATEGDAPAFDETKIDDETTINDDAHDAEPPTKTGEELSDEEEFPDDDDDDFEEDDEDDDDEDEEGDEDEKEEAEDDAS